MGTICIKNGRIWDGEQFSYGDIYVKNGKIQKIGSDICGKSGEILHLGGNIHETADYVYDAGGKVVSAGLVDGHVHMRGISSTQFDIQAEMACFPFGVTAAVDASGVHGDRALLDSFMLKNRVLVCAKFKNNTADFTQAEEMLQKYGDKAVGIKVYFDTHVSEVSDIKPLKEVVDFARAKNLLVMVHSSNSPVPMPELLASLGKGDILTHAYHGGKNNVSEDNFACIREAKQRGVIIDAGLAGHIHTDFRIFREAIECGAGPDVISTDITKWSAYKRGGRYGMTMCMSIARTLGMSEESIFRAVTSKPVKVFGVEGEWGYLKEGRCADIAVFDYTDEGFHLTDKAGNQVGDPHGYRCILTISDGQIVFRD